MRPAVKRMQVQFDISRITHKDLCLIPLWSRRATAAFEYLKVESEVAAKPLQFAMQQLQIRIM